MSDTELLPKSRPEPVRRLEVFTGAGRRRTWSAEQKAEIVAESYGSGESVCAVARRHGLTPQQLFGWRRDARRRAEGAGESGVAFAPVIVTRASPVAASEAPARPSQSCTGMIEIVIGAATVRIPPATDAATLKTVLRALAALA
ncbi:MAG TPA: transposase [Casimicrobiaceae bacterium]|nr:transposase [Casimicrobiaceae bacterium]